MPGTDYDLVMVSQAVLAAMSQVCWQHVRTMLLDPSQTVLHNMPCDHFGMDTRWQNKVLASFIIGLLTKEIIPLLKVLLRRNFTFLFSSFILPRITYRHVRCPFVQKEKIKKVS